jgi:hypothetical protein
MPNPMPEPSPVEAPSPSSISSGLLERSLLSFALLLVIFALCIPSIPSADMWWHLSTGRYILHTYSIPHTDPFSSTFAGKTWTTHEWLSEVLFYYVYSVVGSPGLLCLCGVVLALAFWLAYRSLPGPLLVRLLALGLGIWAARPSFSVRPLVFTLLLAALFLFFLRRFIAHGTYRHLFALPVLSVLWVNLHGAYILGPALIVLFLLGVATDWFWRLHEAAEAKRRLLGLALALLTCLILVPLNANGFAMYSYPFETLRSSAMQSGIMEWRSPDFHMAIFYPFAALLFLTVAAFALAPSRPRPSEVLLFGFFGLAALHSMRNLPIFVLVAFPLLAAYASIPVRRFWTFPELPLLLRRTLAVCVLILVAVISSNVIADHLSNELSLEQSLFPSKAAAFLDEKHLPAPILNSYDFGGYLIWKLYPRYTIYIDGRADLYGGDFLEKFIHLYQVDVDPRPVLAGIRTVILEPRCALANFLRLQPDWNRVYEDRVAVVFSR